MIKKDTWYQAEHDGKKATFIFLGLDNGDFLELVIRNKECTKKFISIQTLDKWQMEHELETWKLHEIKPQAIESPELAMALEALKALAEICKGIYV